MSFCFSICVHFSGYFFSQEKGISNKSLNTSEESYFSWMLSFFLPLKLKIYTSMFIIGMKRLTP